MHEIQILPTLYQEFDKEAFLDSIKDLIRLDREWVPKTENCSLYVRPTFIGTEVSLSQLASLCPFSSPLPSLPSSFFSFSLLLTSSPNPPFVSLLCPPPFFFPPLLIPPPFFFPPLLPSSFLLS
jgi:hypothetical protein